MIGSTDEALKAAASRLEAAYPGLRVVLLLSPAFGFDPRGPDADACLEAVQASGARLCFVAFGAPKQETLAARGLDRVPGPGTTLGPEDRHGMGVAPGLQPATAGPSLLELPDDPAEPRDRRAADAGAIMTMLAPGQDGPGILIVAPNASSRFGGEAFL
eukprot:gene15154-20507_t